MYSLPWGWEEGVPPLWGREKASDWHTGFRSGRGPNPHSLCLCTELWPRLPHAVGTMEAAGGSHAPCALCCPVPLG